MNSQQRAFDTLARMKVRPDATLLEAFRVIEQGGQEIAFVVDEDDRVTGTVTDGDLRRALLSGAGLDERLLPGVQREDFVWVDADAGRVEVLDLMRARSIRQIPVLDDQRRLAGLHVLQQLMGAMPRSNAAVIMAGGKGQRLMPLTKTIPKPMVRVAGRPILERLVLHVVGYGIRRIFISVNHLRNAIEDYFEDGAAFGCEIRYLREEEPLGTGGALSLLPEPERHPVVVMNGDLVTQADFARLLDFHDSGRFAVTVGLRPWSLEIPFGVATLDGDRLLGLLEKPTEQYIVNAGIYALSPEAIALIPRAQPFPITDIVDRAYDAGFAVGGHLVQGEWLDVGRPDELARARGIT